jgi:hypothetical protein
MGRRRVLKTVEQLECILVCMAAGIPLSQIRRVFAISSDAVQKIKSGQWFRTYTIEGNHVRRHWRKRTDEEKFGAKARCPGCGGMVYMPCRVCSLKKALGLG